MPVSDCVLHVIPQAAPGGAWRGVVELASALERSWGWRTVVCVLGSKEAADVDARHGIRVVYLDSPVHQRLTLFHRLAQLKNLNGMLRPRIIHSHLWPAAFSVGLALHGRRPAHLVHIRDTPGDFSARRWRARLKTSLTAAVVRNRASMLVAVSRDAADYAVRHLHLDPDRVRVAMNGVALDRVFPLRRTPDRGSETEFTIGMAGRLVKSKAHAEMINAVAALLRMNEPVRLKIAGSGSQAESLRAQVLSLGLSDRVEFAGEISDMQSFYGSLDCFVHCSRVAEGLPRVLIEAAAAHVPVITFPCAGARDVFPDDDHGIVLEEPGTDGLVNAIRRLKASRPAAAAMAARAHLRATRLFGIDRLAREIHEIYTEIVDRDGLGERRIS